MGEFVVQELVQEVEVFGAFGEYKRDPSSADGLDDLVGDKLVSLGVLEEGVADLLEGLAGVFIGIDWQPESCGTNDDFVGEGAPGGLTFGIDPMPDRATLHEEDQGVCPSLRVMVAERPRRCLALARRATSSKLWAER